MLFLACLDLTFAFVLTLNIFPPAVKPNVSKPHKLRIHTMEQCNEKFATCFGLLSKDGGFLGQVLYGRGDLPGGVQMRFAETIERYCKSLEAGLKCVDDALRGCAPLIEKPVIKKVRVFMRSFRQIDLCTKDTYRDAFLDQDECFFGLRSDPVRSQCVHSLISKMNAAQQNVMAADGNVDSLFGQYCRAYQDFATCIADDLRQDCGLRGRDIILHNFYQVMGFQGRKRVCNAPVRSNEVPMMNNDLTYLNSALSQNYVF